MFTRVVLEIDLADYKDQLSGASTIEPTEVPWFGVDGSLRVPVLLITEEDDA